MGAIVWIDILEPKFGHLPIKTQTNITKLCSKFYVVFILRPVTLGAVIALALSIWIGLGTTLNHKADPPLPSPVHNCSYLIGTLSLINQNRTSPATPRGSPVDIPNGYDSNNLTSSHDIDRSLSAIPWFYSISYFYLPGIGLLTVFVVCLLALPFRSLRSPIKTQKKLLFPCLRKHFGVPNDLESLDQNSEEKPLELKQAANNDVKKPSVDYKPNNNDVWIRRESDRMLVGNDELNTGEYSYSKLTHQDYY
ncbi:hypothetical protein LSH36_274g04023 [Paralvinella palmiformis]|uniref:Uncharacterized protein n=1 Tax=Paralvinella palmiformis TaxID=53620 RepID=A0AAD9N202_9ANNE|nr:hypothetical protein LSH36_274g04023 [Paralvinella palmiformis]